MQLRNLQFCDLEQCEPRVAFETHISDSVVACCTDIGIRSVCNRRSKMLQHHRITLGPRHVYAIRL